jgi:hypothetical protein
MRQGNANDSVLYGSTVSPTFARLHTASKLPAFLAAYPDTAVEMAASAGIPAKLNAFSERKPDGIPG